MCTKIRIQVKLFKRLPKSVREKKRLVIPKRVEVNALRNCAAECWRWMVSALVSEESLSQNFDSLVEHKEAQVTHSWLRPPAHNNSNNWTEGGGVATASYCSFASALAAWETLALSKRHSRCFGGTVHNTIHTASNEISEKWTIGLLAVNRYKTTWVV